ncbi:hypothetical protein [Deinococcus marmoris]|uniref:Uncharacterized protein n=1 Tax=Deinococcus marmoris TaxID=249408 RepID=A0A1U7P4R8_9DEIO|nr:hypothetical protein [Deinococcus marmoris]OLV20162.1 hypothetical protein BOO71_0000514 [Deinococcus marmoris]
MIFSLAPTTESYDVLRLTSETAQWEFGCHRVLFGVRVVANRVGGGVYAVNYCAGADPVRIGVLRSLVQQILEGLPESVSEGEVLALMPRWTVRPMHNDPVCFEALVLLARQATAKAGAA